MSDNTARDQHLYRITWDNLQYAVRSGQRDNARRYARQLSRIGARLGMVGYDA